jgi:hypothetical protein
MPVTTAEPEKGRKSRGLLLLAVLLPLLTLLAVWVLAPLVHWQGQVGSMILGAGISSSGSGGSPQGFSSHPVTPRGWFILRLGDWHWWVAFL